LTREPTGNARCLRTARAHARRHVDTDVLRELEVHAERGKPSGSPVRADLPVQRGRVSPIVIPPRGHDLAWGELHLLIGIGSRLEPGGVTAPGRSPFVSNH